MATQRDLFDPAAGAAARDRALDRVALGNPELVAAAYEAIRTLVRSDLAEFTTDDVWRLLGDVGEAEPRAIGAAMQRARRERLIAPTSRYKASVRAICHRAPKRIWSCLPSRGGAS